MDATEIRRCEICNKSVHRASYAKHLRSKTHEENQKIIPSNFFNEPSSSKPKKIKQVPTLKELAKQKITIKGKVLENEIAKRMISPYYFSRRFENQYKINLDSHNVNHLNSKITITNKYDFPIEMYDVDSILREMSIIYARLIDQYKFKYQVVFSAEFDKEDEFGFISDKTELFISLKINQILTLRDIEETNIYSQLDSQITNQEMKDSGWRFNKLISMTIYFYKTKELNGSSYVKIPLRSSAILNIENDDKYCFLWSILAFLHPCENSHPNRVSNYRQYFDELKIDGIDFTDGFKTSDVVKFEKLNNLSVNIFELKFYQDGINWKHKLVPIEISKNIFQCSECSDKMYCNECNSKKVIDLMIYKNHYVLIKKLHVFLGKQDCRFVCRRCLSCFKYENVLLKHKYKCEQQEITSYSFSKDSHIYWKKHFHKIPLYFRIYADFECNNEINNSNIGNKTTNIFKQNPTCNGYYIVSELNDVLQSGYYKSPFGENNVDWFVDEVIKLENKMSFYFKNTNKVIKMTQEDEEDFQNTNICWFCEKEILDNKVRDHCHLTGKYRGPAHYYCNINVKKKDSNFSHLHFTILVTMIVICSLKN